MKIQKIIIDNNPIFWNQRVEFDFIKLDWSAVDTIIFVWENWCGKSTMLEDIIFQFSNLSLLSLKDSSERRWFQIELTSIEREKIESLDVQFQWIGTILQFSYNLSIINNRSQITISDLSSKNINSVNFCQHPEIKKIFKSIYSSAEIDFTGKIPTTSSNKDIDIELKSSIKSPTNLANDITQLLVDIAKQDDTDDAAYMKTEQRAWRVPDLTKTELRTSRFKNAFKKLFDNKLIFKWVIWTTPNFEKWSNIFDINKLSSWEKQIVFRGWFLLKDQNSLLWSPVLIDEPEISLHPSWQLKILDFYRTIFTDSNTQLQTSQLFISTHSPYIFKTAQLNSYKLFIFHRNESTQQVEIIPWTILGSLYWTPTRWEINRYAYWLPTLEYHDELYWFLHERFTISGIDDITKEQYSKIPEFDKYITTAIPTIPTKNRTEEKYKSKGFKTKSLTVSLPTFIRHKSHHPENRTMQPKDFTLDELRQSIEYLISLL